MCQVIVIIPHARWSLLIMQTFCAPFPALFWIHFPNFSFLALVIWISITSFGSLVVTLFLSETFLLNSCFRTSNANSTFWPLSPAIWNYFWIRSQIIFNNAIIFALLKILVLSYLFRFLRMLFSPATLSVVMWSFQHKYYFSSHSLDSAVRRQRGKI